MAINSHYITTKALEEYLVNRTTGEPLAGGTVELYKDDDRLEPKDIFQLSGAPPNYTFTALPNPITLSSVGTIQNGSGDNVALYYMPYTSDEDGAEIELYYVVVKDADGNIQFTREGWPNFDEASQFDSTEGTMTNEISNSQFVTVLFNTTLGLTIPYTGSATTTVDIAPDWTIEIIHTGAGTLSVARNNIAGTSNTATNPPYTLTITPGVNITGLKLIQRLENNPDIWTPANTGDRGFIAGGALLGVNTSLVMTYVPSSGTAQTIFTASNSTGAIAYFGDTVQLDPGDNSQTGATGYVDIELTLSASNPTIISSVQVIGLESEQSNIFYRQDSVNRQKDYLAHYYNPLLQYKPIPSYLVGWNFPLNPAQFLGSSVAAQTVGANKSYYVWDQTILFQTTNSGITTSRDATGALKTLSASASATQIALVQYVPAPLAIEMLSRRKCVNISANASVATNATVSLWYTTGALPSAIGSNNSMVLTLDADGYPATQNGTWVQVPRSGLGYSSVTTSATNAAKFTIATAPTGAASFNQYPLSGWDMEGATDINNATFFAIVVGTASLAQNAYVLWQDISCQDGDIPTVSAPKTKDESLRECQYFYEMSFPVGTTPAQNVGAATGEFLFPALFDTVASQFAVGTLYRVQKYATPTTVTTYNPAAANAQIRDETANVDCSGTNVNTNTKNGFMLAYTLNGGGGSVFGNKMGVHWTSDARLGQ